MITLLTRLPYILHVYVAVLCRLFSLVPSSSYPHYPLTTHHPHLPYTSPSPPHTPCSQPHDSPAAVASSCHAHGLGRGGVVDKYNGTVLYVLYITTKHDTLSGFTQALSTCEQKKAGLAMVQKIVLAIDRPLHKTLQRRVWHQAGDR